MEVITKKVFISYSWVVQEKVIELAERLIANGVDVILDVYDLGDGDDKYVFMEQSVNNSEIDHVLIICDKTYTEKANNRTGGVGDETVIITPELYGNVKQDKFIPIIFEKDEDGKPYCPHYIKSRIYIDLTDEATYESEYEKLLRDIYKKPLYKKPALGKKPEWLENDTIDLSPIRDVVKQVRGFSGNNYTKADFLLRRALDEFIIAGKQYVLTKDGDSGEELLSLIEQCKTYRDVFVDFCEALIYSGLPLSDTLSHLFERLYNELHEADERKSYSSYDYELQDYIIWELLICMIATLLHYEKFKEIHDILIHPYFIRRDFFNPDVEAFNYFKFRPVFRRIENECKPKSKEPNRYTMAGDILIKREKRPILTKESISNADLVLYQLGVLLPVSHLNGYNYWFPLTYVYHQSVQVMWQKLKSKTYCLKIAPLFGVTTIDELKNIVQNSVVDERMKYNYAWECANSILSSIDFEDIATLN